MFERITRFANDNRPFPSRPHDIFWAALLGALIGTLLSTTIPLIATWYAGSQRTGTAPTTIPTETLTEEFCITDPAEIQRVIGADLFVGSYALDHEGHVNAYVIPRYPVQLGILKATCVSLDDAMVTLPRFLSIINGNILPAE